MIMHKKITIAKGFTLIELMIAVVIVGILAMIAYPSYTAHIQKTKRSDAKVALQEVAQRQESYFLREYSYAKDLTQLGYPASSHDNLYTLAVTSTPAGCSGLKANACSGFSVTATAASGKAQAGDKACQSFTLDNRGTKAAKDNTNTASTVCW